MCSVGSRAAELLFDRQTVPQFRHLQASWATEMCTTVHEVGACLLPLCSTVRWCTTPSKGGKPSFVVSASLRWWRAGVGPSLLRWGRVVVSAGQLVDNQAEGPVLLGRRPPSAELGGGEPAAASPTHPPSVTGGQAGRMLLGEVLPRERRSGDP